MSILGVPNLHRVPNELDSTRTANDLPLVLMCNWFVYVSTGLDAVRMASPEGLSLKSAPGKFLDFTVNVA